MAEEPKDLPTNKARQGIELHRIRYVLIISFIGALVGMALVWSHFQ